MWSDLLRWARITKPGTDTEQFATQQMEYLGKLCDGLIVFPYGMHGNVPADALALMFAMNGSTENRAAIAWTPKNRPKLSDGEVAFYHPPTDAYIIWKESGNLEIQTGNNGSADVIINCNNANITASSSVTVDAPTTTFTGDVNIDKNLNVTQDFTSTGSMTNNGKDIGDTHGHIQGPDSKGDIESPINGVT